jgi:ribosomal protein S18 acetylase RimI-like enzyme
MDIRYRSSLDGLPSHTIDGFFVGWANPPDGTTLFKMLEASSHVGLAFDGDRLIGYVRAVSDGFFSAFIPELEVLPEYQGLSVGSTLLSNLLEDLQSFYSIDTACDDELVAFYQRFGFLHGNGMMIRHYEHQAGT